LRNEDFCPGLAAVALLLAGISAQVPNRRWLVSGVLRAAPDTWRVIIETAGEPRSAGIVENAGAGGLIGAQYVAKARPTDTRSWSTPAFVGAVAHPGSADPKDLVPVATMADTDRAGGDPI
jgi:hypothetical protein